MLPGLTTFADATSDGTPRTRIPVARLGKFSDPRYGKFAITREMVDSWRRNLTERFGGRVAIDLDHSSEKAVGRKTEAAAWITSLEVDGDTVYSDVEWTPLGEQAIREKRYLYISPTFVADHKDEQGSGHGEALIGAGLTNRPFLRAGMPAISLSEAPVFAEAEEPAMEINLNLPPRDGLARIHAGESIAPASYFTTTGAGTSAVSFPPVPSDSRPRMAFNEEITKALSLDADADEAKVLEAVKALAERPEPEVKSLDEQAKAEGKVVLDESRVKALETSAEKGVDALKELRQSKFDAAVEKARSEVRLDTKDETYERLQKLYGADPEDTIALIDGLPKLAPTEATGSGKGPAGEAAPAGTDPEAFELDAKANAYMREHKLEDTAENYITAVEAVQAVAV